MQPASGCIAWIGYPLCPVNAQVVVSVVPVHPRPLAGLHIVFPEIVEPAGIVAGGISIAPEKPEVVVPAFKAESIGPRAGMVRRSCCTGLSVNAGFIRRVSPVDP